MITILTHSPSLFSKERLKAGFKTLLRQQRGPTAVAKSLDRGLTELNIPHNINPAPKDYYPVVHVVSGVGALKRAIELKKKGKIQKIIAGPNLVLFPDEENRIMYDKHIDAIVFPSSWPKDYWVSIDAYFKDRVCVWPAGVATSATFSQRNTGRWLIYQKNAPIELLSKIETALASRKIPYTVIRYGSFKKEEYYSLLENSDAMIYLSESESQGLALHEAWMRDVPTFVWNRGFWKIGSITWHDKSISAPYLTDATGLFFAENDLTSGLDTFISRLASFEPRKHSLQHFTDAIATRALLGIIDYHENK